MSIRLITHENARREGDAMPYTGNFDFFYGMESERYNFIIIPKLLMKDERFSHISAEAKLMYGLLLDRNSLSQKNGWLDAENRVYIIYTIEEMKKDLGCASEKVSKVLKELEAIGLIYRKRNGRGKANYIYVMDYMALYRREQTAKEGADGAATSFQNFENRNVIKLIRIILIIVIYPTGRDTKTVFVTSNKEIIILKSWSVCFLPILPLK